ncbi:MAG: mechanosensitive ion channel protein MscS [Oceanospirillaceae bacterium]|nr:mechanosensitive ion channel protein MscS [Oceanospirillaceae bacterium]
MDDSVKQELEQIQAIYDLVVQFFVNYSFQIVGALIILLLGLWVAGRVSRWTLGLMQRHNMDITLSRFIASCVKILLVAVVAIIVLGKLGISVTPLVAMIGAVGLGAGLAIQGLLSNYSAGLTIVVTRPYVVGDTISVQGVTGQVKEVHLSHTLLTNEDGVEISIPNKHIIGEIIHNSHQHMLAEVAIDIAYSADPERATEVLKAALNGFKEDLCQEPAPQVGIEAFGESGITLGIRLWIPTERYYDVLYRANLAMFNALKAEGIEIPFPQREVRLLNATGVGG